VGRDGSIDWLCWPHFDSDACFAAVLGTSEDGRWQIAPKDKAAKVTRRYRPNTLILEMLFETADGAATLIDFMPPREGSSHLLRLLVGERGEVELHDELILRFGYSATVPWVTRINDHTMRAVAGLDMGCCIRRRRFAASISAPSAISASMPARRRASACLLRSRTRNCLKQTRMRYRGGAAPGVVPPACGSAERAFSSNVRVASTQARVESPGSHRTATVASPLRKKNAAPRPPPPPRMPSSRNRPSRSGSFRRSE
jgi:Domain of unknown function (DUF5911)